MDKDRKLDVKESVAVLLRCRRPNHKLAGSAYSGENSFGPNAHKLAHV